MLGLGDIVSICHPLIVCLSSLENSVILVLLKSYRVLILATLDTASKINKKKNLLEF